MPPSTFRPELHGVRGLAIALVVLFHLFGHGRVSGGIDAFLTVSGFLMTLSLARQLERGTLSLTGYLARLARRLLPAALIVLAAVAVAGYVWTPATQRAQLLRELRATVLYRENWELISSQLDYAAAGPATSPLQHFWSLSVQGQFYLLWFVLLSLAAWAGRRIGWSVRTSVLVAVGIATLASFVAEVGWLAHDQEVAYLHTGGRIWELGVGGLVGLLLPRLRQSVPARLVTGWLGVTLLVSCGFVFDGRQQFPGPWALWPVAGVLLVLAAGATGRRWSADRMLTLRPFTFLGDISYAWYLWHWPVLIFTLLVVGRDTAGLRAASFVLVVSVLLAWATTRLVELPVGRYLAGRPVTTLIAGALAVGLAATAGSTALAAVQQRQDERLAEASRPSPDHPGAAALDPGWRGTLADAAPVPALSAIAQDKPTVYELDGCIKTHRDTPESAEPGICFLGPDDAKHTVLVVGGSHVTQWMPALQLVAEGRGWRLAFAEKGGCQFLARPAPGSHDPEQTESCYAYDENLWPLIDDLDPDYVFTLSTTSRMDDSEGTPQGFVDYWRRLDQRGIPVLALRDSTRLERDVPECLEASQMDAHRCGQARTARLKAESPVLQVADLPANVRPMDLTDRICRPDWCEAIEGNVIVYRDTSHLTGTYVRTLAPYLEDELRRVAPELF